jgi:hypothetical protein
MQWDAQVRDDGNEAVTQMLRAKFAYDVRQVARIYANVTFGPLCILVGRMLAPEAHIPAWKLTFTARSTVLIKGNPCYEARFSPRVQRV